MHSFSISSAYILFMGLGLQSTLIASSSSYFSLIRISLLVIQFFSFVIQRYQALFQASGSGSASFSYPLFFQNSDIQFVVSQATICLALLLLARRFIISYLCRGRFPFIPFLDTSSYSRAYIPKCLSSTSIRNLSRLISKVLIGDLFSIQQIYLQTFSKRSISQIAFRYTFLNTFSSSKVLSSQIY